MAQATAPGPPRPPLSGDDGIDPNPESVINLVTGLPRSGTSMMMQMLAGGGCVPLTDGERPADAGNPRGYLEYAPVLRLHTERGWLHLARGRCLKVVAPLLPALPLTAGDGSPFLYRCVFMHRDWRQVADSQHRLLRLLGREHLAGPEDLLARAFQRDLESARRWLDGSGIPVLDCDYRAILADPEAAARRLADFIPGLRPERARAAFLSPRSA